MGKKMTANKLNIINTQSVQNYLSNYKAAFRKMQRHCAPVINFSEIDYITYVKQHKDHFYHFSTETAEQTTYKFEHPYFTPLSVGAEKTTTMSWSQHHNQRFLTDFLHETKMNNGIVMIYKHEDYNEYVSIGTRSAQHNLLLNYLTNPENIKRLAVYIKQACRKSMKKQPATTVTFDQPVSKVNIDIPSISLPNLRSAKYAFVGLNGDVLLTKMEFECLKNILTLKTSRESAKALQLSPKTIEAHIAKLKKKLGVKSKSQMFELALENGLVYA